MAAQHERYEVRDADVLFEDVWAEDAPDARACTACGARASAGALACEACGKPLAVCSGSCSSCGSPVCVGEKRGR